MRQSLFGCSLPALWRWSVLWKAGVIGVLILVFYPIHPVLAHEGQPPAPHDFWGAWNWDPLLLTCLVLAVLGYIRGVLRLWRRAGIGRGISRKQAAAYAAGILALFVALISPLDPLSEALFSAHMVQHLLLMVVAAPLLIIGAPLFAFLWALPSDGRKTVGQWWQQATIWQYLWQFISHPLVVWMLYAVTLWMWHFPVFYEAALQDDLIHEIEHITFLGTSALFFWILFSPMGHRRLNRGTGILYLFTTALHSSALGVLITFSPQPWYPGHAPYTEAWRLTPLQDQQLAGSIMWMPVCMIYVLIAAILFVTWLVRIEDESSLELSVQDAPSEIK